MGRVTRLALLWASAREEMGTKDGVRSVPQSGAAPGGGRVLRRQEALVRFAPRPTIVHPLPRAERLSILPAPGDIGIGLDETTTARKRFQGVSSKERRPFACGVAEALPLQRAQQVRSGEGRVVPEELGDVEAAATFDQRQCHPQPLLGAATAAAPQHHPLQVAELVEEEQQV